MSRSLENRREFSLPNNLDKYEYKYKCKYKYDWIGTMDRNLFRPMTWTNMGVNMLHIVTKVQFPISLMSTSVNIVLMSIELKYY